MKIIHSFTMRVLMIMVSLLLLFCAVSTIAWYRSFTQEAVETAEEHMDTVIETLNEMFDEKLREIDYTTAFISNKVRTTQNDSIIQFLTASEPNMQVASRQSAQNYLFNRCNFKAYLNGMAIYGLDGRTCTYGITTPYDEVADTEWFESIKNGEKDVVYLTPRAYTEKQPSPKNSYVFSIVRPVFYGSRIVGVIKADIKSSLLETIFDIREMKGYSLYVFDRDTKETVYSPEETNFLNVSDFCDSIPEGDGTFTKRQGGVTWLVVYTTSEVAPWQIVGVVQQSTVLAGFLQVRNQMTVMVILFVIVFALIAFVVSYYLTKDLRKLTGAVEKIGDDCLELPISIKRRDEVGILYQQIRTMLERIRDLITNIRKVEEEKRISEIEMLSIQINPHFLYNTLDIIVWMVENEQPTEAVRLVTALARFFRISLSGGRNVIPVRDELEHVRNYLVIQEMRYKNKFHYQIHAEDETLGLSTIKLMIQPIVENAICHGMEFMDETGLITIDAAIQDGDLVIAVKDNGLGMTEEQVARLLDPNAPPEAAPRAKKGSGVGLQNVQSRIRLYFGPGYGLTIESEPDLGTKVTFRLPAIPYGEMEDL
mgnify:CR=1 FL=1